MPSLPTPSPAADAPLVADAPQADAATQGEATPRSDAAPQGDATPHSDAAPQGDATPHSDAAPEGDATPQADAAPQADAELQSDAPPRTDATPPAGTPPPAETGLLLRQRFPALFGNPPKPLKLRIQVDIQARAPGVFTKQALSAFFRRYTGSHAYLVAVAHAKERFDLDGAAAGELSAEHRQAAADELARRRGNQQARRELEAQQRRNRAGLLHDFERTTLTAANFCALKGVAVDELDGLLALARQEAAEAPPAARPRFEAARRPADPRRQRSPHT